MSEVTVNPDLTSEVRALVDEAREWPRDMGEGALINALADALLAELAERNLWKRRCAEETRAWIDEAARVSALYAVIKEVAAYADDRAFHARGHLNTVNSGRIASDLRQILAQINEREARA